MFSALRAPFAHLTAALFGMTGLTGASAAAAASSQIEATAAYKLELLTPKVAPGRAHLVVRFVDGAGKPVPGAVVTATRLDMSPAGMGSMTAPVTAAKATKPGLYAFDTTLGMPGRWALTVTAKAPRQTTPMVATYTVTAGQ